MNRIELNARAKINLSLDVLKKRPDGYHELRMIMQTVELHDRVLLERMEDGIEIASNSPWIPSGPGNIAYKAADLLIKEFGIKEGIRISIDKKIPVAAGLAGGSSDAAAVLKGINAMFGLGLSEEELARRGKSIGADVPYCIRGGTMLAEGIGEALSKISPLPGVDIVLVKPRISVPTAWVYKNLVIDKIVQRPDTDKLIDAVKQKNLKVLAKNMVNVLENVTIKKYTVISDIKDRLLEYGALGSMMSGSGPTVFGIFSDRASAAKAFETLSGGQWDVFLTKTICEER